MSSRRLGVSILGLLLTALAGIALADEATSDRTDWPKSVAASLVLPPAAQDRQEPPARAASGYGAWLRGRLLGADDRAVAGASIAVEASSGETLARGKSDGTGTFDLPISASATVDELRVARVVVIAAGAPQLFLGMPAIGRLEPVYDCGNLRLPSGCRVRGAVRDALGRPVPEAEVEWLFLDLAASSGGSSAVACAGSASAAADPRGRFAFEGCLQPGRWRARIEGHSLVDDVVEVPSGRRRWACRLVVRPQRTGVQVSGRVVGRDGQAIAAARVRASVTTPGTVPVRCGPDGGFRMDQLVGQPGRCVELVAELDGVEIARSRQPVRWGQRGVVLRAERVRTWTVVVRRQRDGSPVTDYALTFRSQEGGERRLEVGSADGRGSFLVGGAGVVRIDPAPGSGLECGRSVPVPALAEFDRSESVVRLAESARRTLVARSFRGEPVVGAEVELVERIVQHGGQDPELSWATPVEATADAVTNERLTARLLSRHTTDALGRVELRGAPGRSFAVRIRASGHGSLVRSGVRLDLPGPLRVRLPRAARVLGRLGPKSVVDQLFDGVPADALPMRRPGVRLVALGTKARAGGPRIALCRDGSFAIDDVSPGDWRLELVFATELYSGWRLHCEALQTLRIAPGMDCRVDADVGHLARYEVRGVLELNNAVAASTAFELRPDGSGPPEYGSSDAVGRFRLRVRPGSYRLVLRVRRGPRWCELPIADPVVVTANGDGVSVGRRRAIAAELELTLARDRVSPLELVGPGSVRIQLPVNDRGVGRWPLLGAGSWRLLRRGVELGGFEAGRTPTRLRLERSGLIRS